MGKNLKSFSVCTHHSAVSHATTISTEKRWECTKPFDQTHRQYQLHSIMAFQSMR